MSGEAMLTKLDAARANGFHPGRTMATKRAKQKNGEGGVVSEQARLAARWDEVVARAKVINWARTGILMLAAKADLEWFAGRGYEPVTRFLALDGSRLLSREDLGDEKVRRLCEILERTLEARGIAPLETGDPYETLAAWQVPADLPFRLCILPTGMTNHCERRGLDTLAQVLDEWAVLGYAGFLARKGLGKDSLKPFETFVSSLRAADRETASLFLPLHPSGRGLSLARALELVAREPTPTERAILTRRLVERMSLKESTGGHVLTREGVRQVEQRFLTPLQRWVDHFCDEREHMLEDWVAGRDWFARLRNEVSPEHEDLLKGGLEDGFRASPQGATVEWDRATRVERLHESLIHHPQLWFGGVRLADFLEAQVPPEDRQAFSNRLARSSELRIDDAEGKVHPAVTSLRRAVLGLLAAEKKPIPLSTLIRRLIRTGYHPEVTPIMVRQRRAEWCRLHAFPRDRVLWEE